MPNLLVEAGPGCGKTHTISDAYIYAKHLNHQLFVSKFGPTEEQIAIYEWFYKNFKGCTKPPIYMAYNNDIVADMKKRVHTDCTELVKTHHGHGYTIIKKKHGYVPINEKRGEILVQEIEGAPMSSLKNKWEWLTTLKFVEKLKMELLPISEQNFYLLQMKYNDLAPFRIHSNMTQQAAKLIQAMKKIDYKQGIQYVDQVWLAIFLLREPIYEWGFVDESQDLSPYLLELSKRLCKNLLFVGDSNQAINAWNGADPMAMRRIEAECEGVKTLTQSFRLTPSHAEHANKIRPTARLRSTPGKKDGVTQTIDREETLSILEQMHEHSPMVLCRYNAPLVRLALRCAREGMPVHCLGSKMMEGLISVVENRNASNISELQAKLDAYEDKLLSTGDEMSKDYNKDRMDTIRYVLEQCTTIEEFTPTIKRLLAPSKKTNHIIFSTVHKAKGRENANIFILNHPVASPKATTPIQKEQEINVSFVAETRSKLNKYYVYS